MIEKQEELSNEIVQEVVKIEAQGDLLKVENVFKEFQKQHPAFEKKFQEMALIAGELCENILKHSGKGKISIRYHQSAMPYIEVLSENVGELPENAQTNGVTTKHSLGIGLGIISRRSDIFTHEQDGKILRLRSVKYCGDLPARSEVTVLSYPVTPCEKCNGDSFFIHKDQTDLLCVIDALGHGEDAYKSAAAVHDFIQENPKRKIDALIYEVHDFIRARHIRGVALSVIRIDYASNKLLFCGLGDVMVKIFLPDEDKTLYPLPKEGIVGDIQRTLEIQEFPIVKGEVISMFSDGVSSKLTIPVTARNENLMNLVNNLMGQYGKNYDDRTLLLAKVL